MRPVLAQSRKPLPQRHRVWVRNHHQGLLCQLIAGCATDIMLSRYQFSLKVRDPNSITRIVPGMDEIQINYQRCVF